MAGFGPSTTSTPSVDRVRELIANTVARFCDLLDSGDHQGAAALLAEDATYYSLSAEYTDDVPPEARHWDFVGRSRQDVIDFWDWGHRRYEYLPVTLDGIPVRSIYAAPDIDDSLLSSHVMCNLDIEVDGDVGTARARSYMFCYQATPWFEFQPTHVMRCRDRWVRRDGTWEWVERYHVPFWYENMSGHSARDGHGGISARVVEPERHVGLDATGARQAGKAAGEAREIVVTTLSARHQIENTLARFCDHFDSGRFEQAGELLAPDARYYASFFTAGSPAELVDFWKQNVILHHGGTPQTAHVNGNIDIEFDDDEQSAVVSTSVVCYQCLPDFPLQATHVVRCIDRFRRRGDLWEWIERRILPYLYGDTSRHAVRHNQPGPWDPHKPAGGSMSGAARPPIRPIEIEELLAKYEIHELLMRCIRAFDTEEWDVVRDCFHPGAVHDHGTWRGPVEELIEREIATYKKLTGNFHFAGNELIAVAGETAHSELYSVCWHRRRPEEGEPEIDLVSGMRYLDTLERRDGRWRIVNRLVEVDWHRADPVIPFDQTAFLAHLAGPGSGIR